MRSAPFRRIVVADSLGWLLFLTEINFSSLENFRNEKKTFKTKNSFENFFDAPVSACACAKVRDQCFWPSSARLCLVKFHRPVCLRSIEFLRVRVQWYIVLVSFGFPQSNSIALCAFICARSYSFMFSRNDAWLLKYWILHFNLEKNDMFFRSQNLAKKRTGLINSNMKNWSAQKFKKRTKRFNSSNNEVSSTALIPPVPGTVHTRALADWGPFPSAAEIVEAYEKPPNGVEGRLTR